MLKKLMMTGLFVAACLPAFAQATAPAAPAGPPAAVIPANGTWKVTGSVQGVDVTMSCVLAVGADKTITGTCTDNTGTSSAPHPVTGTVKDQTLTWAFNSDYQGTAITVNMVGTVDASGTKMAGTIAVDPMSADGDFTASLQVAA